MARPQCRGIHGNEARVRPAATAPSRACAETRKGARPRVREAQAVCEHEHQRAMGTRHLHGLAWCTGAWPAASSRSTARLWPPQTNRVSGPARSAAGHSRRDQVRRSRQRRVFVQALQAHDHTKEIVTRRCQRTPHTGHTGGASPRGRRRREAARIPMSLRYTLPSCPVRSFPPRPVTYIVAGYRFKRAEALGHAGSQASRCSAPAAAPAAESSGAARDLHRGGRFGARGTAPHRPLPVPWRRVHSTIVKSGPDAKPSARNGGGRARRPRELC